MEFNICRGFVDEEQVPRYLIIYIYTKRANSTIRHFFPTLRLHRRHHDHTILKCLVPGYQTDMTPCEVDPITTWNRTPLHILAHGLSRDGGHAEYPSFLLRTTMLLYTSVPPKHLLGFR